MLFRTQIILLALILLSCTQIERATATEIYPWEVSCMEAALKAPASMTGGGPESGTAGGKSCPALEVRIEPQCSELTDQLCETMWSSKNRGNLKLADGTIDVGTSKKSLMASSKLADLQALIASQPRLAPDTQVKVKPVVDRLEVALQNEKDSKEWYRTIALLEYEYAIAVEDVASNRTEANHPELKAIKEADLKVEQRALYKNDRNAVSSENLTAKYAENPNWLGSKRIFKDVKADIIAEIRTLPIPDERKADFVKHMESIEISLPFEDGHLLGADSACGSTDINAFYNGTFKKFTVCAGLFNSFQSEASVYAVIAHEMAHAIDPLSTADRQRLRNSPVVKELTPLMNSKGQAVDCAEWKQKVNRIANDSLRTPAPGEKESLADPMQRLYDCLHPKTSLKPITKQALDDIAARNNKHTLSSFADGNSFVTLAQPTVTKYGEVHGNEYFMRPDLYWAAMNQDQFLQTAEEANGAEIFVQALSCASENIDGKETLYKDAKIGQRNDIFRKAIDETSTLLKSMTRNSFEYCGTNCSALTADNLSADSRENFADWVAGRTFNRFLERKSGLRERREAAAAAWSLFCEHPSASNDAPDLAAEQKKFSLETHPNNRVRRLSLFTKKNAASVKCEIKEKDQGFGLCNL